MSSASRKAQLVKMAEDGLARWALEDDVLDALGGLPREPWASIAESLRFREELRNAPPGWVALTQHLERLRQTRRDAIAEWKARNAERSPLVHLASEVARYVRLKRRYGPPVELTRFTREGQARHHLDEAARSVDVSEDVMWQRFEQAIAAAKDGERWQRFPEMLADRLRLFDELFADGGQRSDS